MKRYETINAMKYAYGLDQIKTSDDDFYMENPDKIVMNILSGGRVPEIMSRVFGIETNSTEIRYIDGFGYAELN